MRHELCTPLCITPDQQRVSSYLQSGFFNSLQMKGHVILSIRSQWIPNRLIRISWHQHPKLFCNIKVHVTLCTRDLFVGGMELIRKLVTGKSMTV